MRDALSNFQETHSGREQSLYEALVQHANPDGIVEASPHDLKDWTASGSSRIYRELANLFMTGKLSLVEKANSPRGTTRYRMVCSMTVQTTVPEGLSDSSNLNSAFRQNLEQQVTALSKVPTLHNGLLPIPKVLVPFVRLNGIGRCLDLTCRFIADFGSFRTYLKDSHPHNPKYHGRMQLFHLEHTESGFKSYYHAVIFSYDEDRGYGPADLLLGIVKRVFPTANHVVTDVCYPNHMLNPFYDIGVYCPHCPRGTAPAIIPGYRFRVGIGRP